MRHLARATRRHLVNAYEMHAGWHIPFVDERVGGR